LPTGAEAKQFVRELTRLYSAYADASALECVTFKAAAIITPLLLQQPPGKPNYAENRNHLARRLELWHAGNIKDLLKEGTTIQERLKSSGKISDSSLSKRFATMIFNNNLRGAMALLNDNARGKVKDLDDLTCATMKLKHPNAAPAHIDALITRRYSR
jgi:hypothetical protein